MIRLCTCDTANGQRARIALEEAGIEYSADFPDLGAGAHRTPGMLALNPMGRLPFIVIGAGDSMRTIYGSLAITMYATERAPRLLPGDRIEMYHWFGILMTDLAPALAGEFVFTHLAPARNDWAISLYTGAAERMAAHLDRHLRAHEYFVNAEFSVVDIVAYPIVATSLARLPGGLTRYPALQQWAERVGERPAVQRGMSAEP
jgi:GST-like protein